MDDILNYEQVTTLLQDVFPQAKFSQNYIDWLYFKSPHGQKIDRNLVEEDMLLGHYAVIPQKWCFAEQVCSFALSLNTAVHPNARGKGLFTRLAEETYSLAADKNINGIIGVGNKNSTPGLIRSLGFSFIAPLPVVSGFVLPKSSLATTFRANTEFLTSSLFKNRVEKIAPPNNMLFQQNWNYETLVWRLSSPRWPYWVHEHDSGMLITTKAYYRGLPFIIALKFLLYKHAKNIDASPLLRSAAACHKTPFFIYAGFNSHVKVAGLPLPRSLLPSPLNLVYRHLNSDLPQLTKDSIQTFEFLDFDAY